MEMAQINARLEAGIKREGDATLARLGSSTTEAIRSLWSYLARAKRLPDYMEQDASVVQEMPVVTDAAGQGAGLALRMARERGLTVGDIQGLSYQELRDLAFEEFVEEGKAHA